MCRRTFKPTVFAIALLFLCTWQVSGQTINLQDPEGHQIDQNGISLIQSDEDLSTDEWRELAYESERIFAHELTAGKYYYGKIEIFNLTASSQNTSEWALEFSKVLTDLEAQVVIGSQVINSVTGSFLPPNRRSYSPSSNRNYLKIVIPPGGSATLYFKSFCQRKNLVPDFSFLILSTDELNSKLVKARQGQALFFGFVLMMFIYNLILYFFGQRDIAYIYYSLYLFTIVLFTAYNTGSLADMVFKFFLESKPEYIYFFKLSVYPILLFCFTFLRQFLNLKKLLPIWNSIFKLLTICFLFLLFLDAYFMYVSNFNFKLSDQITVGSSIIFLLVLLAFMPFLYLTKDKKGYFIVIGTLMMCVGVAFAIIGRIQSVDFSTTYYRLGIVLEVIIFSLGLAYRSREAEVEKREAFYELERSKLVQEQELQEKLRLEEIDSLKNRLYTNITHEFRTPLTVIKGMSEQIEGFEKEKQVISRNSSKLLRLVNQMLDLSKIESNQMDIDWVHIDVVKYLAYLTESFYSYAASKKVRLTFYPEDEEIWMDVDEAKMETLVHNLITNAIKFSAGNGKVVLHVKKEEVEGDFYLTMKVKDNGIGIEPDEIVHIFDRFYQNKKVSVGRGTGIGLAIVREVVNLLDGTIKVVSKVNAGTEFTIQLPIQKTTKKKEVLPQIRNNLISENVQNNRSEISSANHQMAEILIVEDNIDVADYVRSILSDKYKTTVFHDGNQGLDFIFEKIPDIIISDVMMPGKNGYEISRMVKNDLRTSHIPIILLTAKATQEDKIQGLSSGADEFLLKPFDKKELLIRIDNLLLKRKQIIANYQSSLSRMASGNIILDSKTSEDSFISRLWAFIDEHIQDKDLSTEVLAASMDLSISQLRRKLKALTGQSPLKFITSYRMQKALDLLRNSDLNVSEVSYNVGYQDPSYFTRVFNQEFQKVPSDVIKHTDV